MRGRELLGKYIQSGLSNDERFELEKLALDDDFLADAWEGLSSKESKNAQKILSRLDQQLRARSPEVKIVPIYKRLWPYAVAASLALVLSVGVLLRSDQGLDSGSMASVSMNQEMTEAQNETMADISNQEESFDDEDIAAIPNKEESVKIAKRANTEPPVPAAVADENVGATGSFASVDLDGQQTESNDGATQNIVTIDPIQNQATPAAPINEPTKELANTKLDVKSSGASYNQPASERIIKTNPEALPNAKARKRIEPADVQIASAKADNKVSKAILTKEDGVELDEDVVSVISLNEGFDLNEYVAIQDSDILIALVDDSNVLVTQDNLDSGLSSQMIARDLSGASLSLVPELADGCAWAKSKYKEDYFDDPSPIKAKDLYNLLKSKGCPTDGSDSFMTELASTYETWAAEQNAIRSSDFSKNNPSVLASEAIQKYREAIAIATDNTLKAKFHFSIASLLFRKLNKYNSGREEALKAIDLDPSFGRPYILIGDIYATTAQSCGDGWNQRLAILAAYDKYTKAKSIDPNSVDEATSKMDKYRSSFPQKQEGFMRGVKNGDEQRVGCWINEIVKVRYRN